MHYIGVHGGKKILRNAFFEMLFSKRTNEKMKKKALMEFIETRREVRPL